MKYLALFSILLLFNSCWKFGSNGSPYEGMHMVSGLRPVYEVNAMTRAISYAEGAKPIFRAGNIYAYNQYIFQVDQGRGIHVINNTDAAHAERIGFINVHGCAQISIRGQYLYTNSLDDLVTLDISNPEEVVEVSRVVSAFPEFRNAQSLFMPEEPGYFTCPHPDSLVVGWVRDSIPATCYKH